MAPRLPTTDTVGAERVLFSVDYPYSDIVDGRRFLDALPLDNDVLQKISHRNADKLLRFRAE